MFGYHSTVQSPYGILSSAWIVSVGNFGTIQIPTKLKQYCTFQHLIMSRPRKRSQWEEPGEPAQGDDLAVAASYAHVPMYKFEQPEDTESEPVKVNEVQVDGESTGSAADIDDEAIVDVQKERTEPVAIEKIESRTDDVDDDDDEKSDDESAVDLTEALARMIDVDDDGADEGSSKKVQRPKTEHEIDPYSTPLEELQSNFQLNLTVEEEEHLRLADGNKHSTSLQLSPAGHITCHMVEDRTIVVECTQKHPLDEGSLLVIRVDDDNNLRLLPLGKVFEVFGPISRPLYTIRLPPPPSRQKVKNEASKVNAERKEEKTKDENEIILSDTDEGETAIIVDLKAGEAEAIQESPLPSDDWSAEGQFTSILAAETRRTVYYIENKAKLLDTFAIMKNSGKGCDASNLFDEEVLNANELYFSDDEEERQFKSNKKKGGQMKSHDVRGGQHIIPGFHSPTPTQIPPPPPPPPPVQHITCNPRQADRHPHMHPQFQQYPQYHPLGNQSYQNHVGQPYQQPQYGYPPLGGFYHPQAGQQYYPPAPYPYSLPPDSQEESDTVYY